MLLRIYVVYLCILDVLFLCWCKYNYVIVRKCCCVFMLLRVISLRIYVVVYLYCCILISLRVYVVAYLCCWVFMWLRFVLLCISIVACLCCSIEIEHCNEKRVKYQHALEFEYKLPYLHVALLTCRV